MCATTVPVRLRKNRGIEVSSVMCHKSVSMSCASNQAILALEQLPQGPGGKCQVTCEQGPGGSGA